MPAPIARTAALAALCLGAATLPAHATTETNDACFRSQDWAGWSTPGDANVLLLRVNKNDIYRVELSPGVKVRRDSFNVLVSRNRGGSWICRPIDLDLVVSDRVGGQQPLIARTLRKLSAAEIAAIPAKDLP